ncbi:MAG: hypothetical protein JXP34_19800 [Planctomycetes bacterium]|nr:hypothetical protein [Planctomycetota bacterium]
MQGRQWLAVACVAILFGAGLFAGDTTYDQAVLDDEPLFFWTFDEEGDFDPAVNLVVPDRIEDELVPQGAATRVDHDAIGSDPILGRAAEFDGAQGTRFYAVDIGGSAVVPGANVVPSQLWAIEFWFQAQGPLDGSRADYLLESVGGSTNDPGLIFDFTVDNYLEMYKGARTGTAGPQVDDNDWHHVIFAFYGNSGGFGVANRRDIIIDGEIYTDRTSDFSAGFSLMQLAVGNTVGGGGLNGFEGRIDEMALYDVGTKLIEDGVDVSVQNEDAEFAFEDFLFLLMDHAGMAEDPGYGEEILSLEPLFYWNFDEDGDTDEAVNLADPDDARDRLAAEGAATRVTHDDIGSGLLLGRAASFDGANGTRFYAADIDAATGPAGLDAVPSQLWALEFWFQLEDPAEERNAYLLESWGSESNTPGIIFDYTEPNYIEIFKGNRTGTAGPQINDAGWHHAIFAFYGDNTGFGVANRRDIIIDGRIFTDRESAFTSGFALIQLAVGNTVAGGGQNGFKGRMDEVALYDVGTKLVEAGYALSPQDVEAEDAFEAVLLDIAEHRKLVSGLCQEESDAVEIQGPEFGEPKGEGVTLGAVFSGADPGGTVTYAWSVASGAAALTDNGDGTATVIASEGGPVRVTVAADDGACPEYGAVTASFTICFETPDQISIAGPASAPPGEPVALTASVDGMDAAPYVDEASAFSSGFSLVQYAVGNTVAGGGQNGFEGRIDEMAIYDIGTKLVDLGIEISPQNAESEEAFRTLVRDIASHARLTGAEYVDAVYDAQPEFYWDFNEDGDFTEAVNVLDPDDVNDWLLPQGAAARVSHDDIGSGLDLGSAAAFDGALGTRFYAADLNGPGDGPGISHIASQLWALEFWFQVQGSTEGNRQDYFVESYGSPTNTNDPGIIYDYTAADYIEMFRAGQRTGTAGPQIHDTGWHHAVFAFYGSSGGFGVANRREIIIDGGDYASLTWSVASGSAEIVDNGDGTASVTCTGAPGEQVVVRAEVRDGPCAGAIAEHTITIGEGGTRFIRANVNGGTLDIGDAISILNFLFSEQPLTCHAAADVNDDGQNDIGDAISLLNYQFVPGSPAPRAPFPDCGPDPTPDTLTCESFPACE